MLARNPTYWRSGHPYVDGVQIIALSPEASRLQSLLAENIDIADGLPTSGQAVASSTVAKPVALRGGSWAGIRFLGNQAPFNNQLVIEAIQYSMNRLELLETTEAYGHHFPTPDFEIVPPGDFFYPAGIKIKKYDPELAQSLLAQAGFGNGLTFNVYCSTGNVIQTIAVAYQSIAKASNITVNVVPVSANMFSTTIPGNQNIARSGQRQHVSSALGNNYFTGGTTNYPLQQPHVFDKLYLQLLATPQNERAQRQLVADMCELVTTTWAGVEAGAFDRVIGKLSNVQGLHDVRTVLDDVWLGDSTASA